jgi:hypothetical protein
VGPGGGERIVLAHFLEGDPRDCWETDFSGLGKALEESGRVRPLLVAPFITTVPGTDAYTDEL